MKKSILLVAFATLCAVMVYAQPRAIGGRLTEGLEFSYEHGIGDKNMLSIDAGFVYNTIRYHYDDAAGNRVRDWHWGYGVEAVVTYDWINPFGASFDKVWDGKGEWNWYMGVGAGANFTFNPWYSGAYGSLTYSQLGVGVAGRIGVEYNFWFPLQLSVDYRPLFGPSIAFANGEHPSIDFYQSGLYAGAIAFAVRYRFGK